MKIIFPYSLISILFYFCSVKSSYSQDTILIRGNVIDSFTAKPIPNVNILEKGTSSGVISNENGMFQIITFSNNKDSLYFSCLGYKPLTLPVSNFNQKEIKKISLSSAIYSINAIVVKSRESALEIVKKAIENIEINYYTGPYIMDGYYREYTKENDNYVKLVEARVSMYNKENPNTSTRSHQYYASEDFKITAFKKSNDFEKCSPELKMINNLESLFAGNSIKYYQSIFNAKSLGLFIFTQDSTTYFENELYFVVSFFSENERVKINGTTLINSNDYSIINFKLNGIIKQQIPLPNGKHLHNLPFSYAINFRKNENKLFPNYAKSTGGTEELDQNSMTLCKSETYAEFMTTGVTSKNVMPFSEKELMNKKKDLFIQYDSFNTSSFEKGNILPPTELERQIEKDIQSKAIKK